MAYGTLADIYWNLGEVELARQNAIKAYELRDRVTDLEKLSIEAEYRLYVTGELEKAVDAFEIARRTYPVSSRFLNDLGVVYGNGSPVESTSTAQPLEIEAAADVELDIANVATVRIRGGGRDAQEKALVMGVKPARRRDLPMAAPP